MLYSYRFNYPNVNHIVNMLDHKKNHVLRIKADARLSISNVTPAMLGQLPQSRGVNFAASLVNVTTLSLNRMEYIVSKIIQR